jgi:hypothetical protein
VYRNGKGEIVEDWSPPGIWPTPGHEARQKREIEEGIHCRLCPAGPKDEVDELVPLRGTIEQWLAEYFEIDLKKIDDEKRQMLEVCRAAHKAG